MFLDNFKLSSCNYMLFFAFLEADIGFWQSNIISAAINAAIIYIFKKLKIRGTFSLFIIFSQNQFPLLYRPIGDKQITSATMVSMRGVVVAVEQYEVSTFCAKKCFFSKVQIHKNHNSLKKYHSNVCEAKKSTYHGFSAD